MNVLALTWRASYTTILAVAGFIGVVGAAVAYLTSWGRTVYAFVRRRWMHRQNAPAAQDEPKGPTVGQVRVLNAVHQYFLEHGKPAPFWELDKLLDREGLALRENAESLPRGLLTPDVTPRGGAFHSNDDLMVTVEGLHYCESGMVTLDLLARVLAFMAKFEKAFLPTPTQPQPLVRAADVQRTLELRPVELERVRLLLNELEWRSLNGAWHDPAKGDWSVTLNPESIRRFRGIRDGSEYLLARDGAGSFSQRLQEELAAAPRPVFTLAGKDEAPAPFGSGPICLRVENEGPADEFEATVVAIQGASEAVPPWHVRWRGAQDRRQKILAGHHAMLELCEAVVASRTGGDDRDGGIPGWRFLRPDGEAFVVPDGLDLREPFPGAVIRITVQVTPRSRPEWVLENTATLILSGRKRGVEWESSRVCRD